MATAIGVVDILATAEAQDVLAQRGIDMSHHRSKLFKAPMVEKADVIIVMTSAHKKALLYNFPQEISLIYFRGREIII